jgi:hypothetical protein
VHSFFSIFEIITLVDAFFVSMENNNSESKKRGLDEVNKESNKKIRESKYDKINSAKYRWLSDIQFKCEDGIILYADKATISLYSNHYSEKFENLKKRAPYIGGDTTIVVNYPSNQVEALLRHIYDREILKLKDLDNNLITFLVLTLKMCGKESEITEEIFEHIFSDEIFLKLSDKVSTEIVIKFMAIYRHRQFAKVILDNHIKTLSVIAKNGYEDIEKITFDSIKNYEVQREPTESTTDIEKLDKVVLLARYKSKCEECEDYRIKYCKEEASKHKVVSLLQLFKKALKFSLPNRKNRRYGQFAASFLREMQGVTLLTEIQGVTQAINLSDDHCRFCLILNNKTSKGSDIILTENENIEHNKELENINTDIHTKVSEEVVMETDFSNNSEKMDQEEKRSQILMLEDSKMQKDNIEKGNQVTKTVISSGPKIRNEVEQDDQTHFSCEARVIEEFEKLVRSF